MREPLGVWVDISRDYINITTGHPLGWVDISRDCINIATGHPFGI